MAEDVSGQEVKSRSWLNTLSLMTLTFSLFLAALCAARLAIHAQNVVEDKSGQCLFKDPHPAEGLIPSDRTLGWGLLVFLAIAAVAYWYPRRRSGHSLLLLAVATMALFAIFLGGAAYYASLETNAALFPVIVGVMSQFLGELGDIYLCAPPYPIALQVARILAISATGSSVIVIAAVTWRTQLERLRVFLSSDSDVVIGLEDDVLPLVMALAEQDRSWDRKLEGNWYRRRGWALLNKLPAWLPSSVFWKARPQVVVIVSSLTDDNAIQARNYGARVLVGNPENEAVLRRILFTVSGARFAIRRVFLTSQDQRENLALFNKIEKLINEKPPNRHRLEVIPRVVVRLDDSREARLWRINNRGAWNIGDESGKGHRGWLADALSSDEVMAKNIVQQSLESGVETLVLVGDSPVASALLDEVAWRRWQRFDLLKAHGERLANWENDSSPIDDWDPDNDEEQKALCQEWVVLCGVQPAERVHSSDEYDFRALRAPISIRRVVLVDPEAKSIKEEWLRTCPPWSAGENTPDKLPIAHPKDWNLAKLEIEAIDDASLQRTGIQNDWGSCLLVTVENDDRRQSQLRRLLADPSRPGPVRLLFRDENIADVDYPPSGRIGWFGPTLVSGGRPPEDSWNDLARQQHCWYSVRYGTDWTTVEDEGSFTIRETSKPWLEFPKPGQPQLPDFFCQDNLRQLRKVLDIIDKNKKYQWRNVSARPNPKIGFFEWQGLCAEVAGQEHEDWLRSRRRYGWEPGARDDSKRKNPNMDHWDALEGKDFNIGLIKALLGRLHASGLDVELPPSSWPLWERTGEVTAHRLSDDREWEDENGNTLLSKRGDWWVEDSRGTKRGVAAARFPEMYELIEGDRYRRLGQVRALLLSNARYVESLEGAQEAPAGSYVVDDGTSQWWVPAAQFRASYKRVE